MARPLTRQVVPGQARFGCFHDCCLSEKNYFDELNFTFDCHDYIAVTHNRNCNRSSIPSTSTADVAYVRRPTRLFQDHDVIFISLTLLSANTVIFCLRNVHNTLEQLQCGSMPNVMAAWPNIDGALALRKFRNSIPCTTSQTLADARCWTAVQ